MAVLICYEFTMPIDGCHMEQVMLGTGQSCPFGDFIPAADWLFSPQPPYFSEIQFFTEESITNFLQYCATFDAGDVGCFEGDYPHLDRYHAQKEALENRKGYERYVLEKLGSEYYLASTIQSIREYTTFVGDIKIDILVVLDLNNLESQIEQSNRLLRFLYIETHQYYSRVP